MDHDAYVAHKHIHRYEKEYQREGDVDDDYLTRFFEEGWSEILLYQFSIGYTIIMICLIFLGHTIAGLDATFMLSIDDSVIEDTYERQILRYIFYLIDYMYFVDLLFKLLYKYSATTNQKSFHNPISAEQLIIDVISVIPFEIFYMKLIPNSTSRVEVWLRCRCVLRIVRLYTYIYHLDRNLSNNAFVVLKLVMMTFEISRTISFIHYVFYCQENKSKCEYRDFRVYFSISHITTNYLLSTGVDFAEFYVAKMTHLYSVFNFFYKICCIYTVSVLVCLKLEKSETIYQYVEEYSNIIDCYHYMKRHNKRDWTYADDRILQVLKSYYDYFLKKRDGTWIDKEINTLLPQSQVTEVLADVSFNALKHSHIFKHLDQHLLRYLSTLIKFDFVVPGEVIILKGTLMSNMIYISHGVLQILSQEDCETSVLNLSGGSCIGEFSLFFQCPSTCTIICQTYSELVILPAKNFNLMIHRYRSEYLELRNLMLRRLKQAYYLHSMRKRNKKKNNILDKIKMFQRDMLSEDAEKKLENYEELLNSYEMYIAHFDRIVVSDDIELVEDPVFLKSSFHFILQPNSPLLNVWEVVIVIICIINCVFYPLYMAGITSDDSENVMSLVVTLVYIFDIYIQMSTAIKTRKGTNITIKSILFYRLSKGTFLLDLFAAIPLEFLLCAIVGKIPDNYYPIVHSNRLLKYYRIEMFLRKFYLSSTNFMTAMEIIIYSIHILFFIYFATIVIMLEHCPIGISCDKFLERHFQNFSAKASIQIFFAKLSITQNMLSSMNFSLPKHLVPSMYFLFNSFLSITFLLLHIQFLSSVIAAYALKQITVLKKQVMIMNISDSIQDTTLNNSQISNFLKDLWSPNELSFLHALTIKSLPSDLKLAYRNLHYMRLFSNNPLFRCLPEEIVYQLCQYITRIRIPRDQDVCYAGQFVKDIMTVERGVLKIFYGEQFKLLRPHDNISVIEALLDIPIQHSVTTVSDCVILSITTNNFSLFLNKFPDTKKVLMSSLRGARLNSNPRTDMTMVIFGEDAALIKSFKIKRSEAIHAIKTIYVKLTKVVGAGMRSRVIPVHHRFTVYYEIFRCCCAYMNVLMTASGYVFAKPYNSDFKHFLFYFDIVSYVDIVIRFHITYYNENGIEITKGSMVFKHYLTGAFFVDFISCFPFNLIVKKEVIYTRMNRMLELYRIIGFSDYLVGVYQRVGLFFYISIFIISTAIFAVIAACDIDKNCSYNYESLEEYPATNKFQAGLDCSNSWLERSKFKSPLAINQAYFSSLFFYVASFFNIGIRNFILTQWSKQMLMSVWAIFGFFSIYILKGCCVATMLFKNDEITTFQDAMKDLVQYLSYRDIDKNLKKEVIDYFEYIWEKRKGKAIKDIIAPFHYSLKLNTLYEIFGKSITDCSIFQKASPSFIKELLPLAKQETFLKTGILYRVNDIHGTIFYLLKGLVEVVGADGNRILTLHPGSLFGCLDNCKMCRQTLTMVANGHVETLTFSSETFHKIVLKFNITSKRFKQAIAFNTDYIQSEIVSRSKSEVNVPTVNINKHVRHRSFFKVFKPNFLYNYEIFIYVMEYLCGVPFEFLILVSIDNKIITFILIYARDLLWIFRMYLKFHTAYEDEYGMLIFNRRKIAKRYIKCKTGFYCDLAINFPIDLLTFYIVPNYRETKFDQIYHVLRMIKLFRIGFLFNYVGKLTKRLNVNVFLVRSLNLLLRLVYILQVQGLIFYIFEMDWVESASKESRTQEMFKCLSTVIVLFCRGTIRHQFSNWSSLCLIVLLYCDACILVWVYSEFVSTRQIVSQVKSLRKKTIKSLFTFLGIINISKPEIKSIENFLTHFAKVRIGTEFPALLNEAPYYLREAVMYSMFGHHLERHPIFQKCHVDFIRQLAGHMKSQSFYRNYILTKGDIDSTIYFIQQGLVHAISKDSLYTEIVEHILNPGDCFGYEQLVYPNVGHYYTYKTETLVVVATIHRSDLMKLLKFFPASQKHIYNKTYDPV